MKKLLSVLALASLISTPSFAAMDCAYTSETTLTYIPGHGGTYLTEYTCTFDTTPATAEDTLTASEMRHIRGAYPYQFTTKAGGATGPSDNSDLAIVDSDGLTWIGAAANGANIVDESDAVKNIEYFQGPGGADGFIAVNKADLWTITVTNNAVNNSSFILGIISVD